MALRTTTFEVMLESQRKALAFDLRTAVVDWLRLRIRQKFDTAEDAGVDKKTALQKFCLNYAGAAKASRLARGVPATLVRWASYVEYNNVMDWFPAAPPRCVGTFDKDSLTVLPSNVALIRMGGIEFVGTLEGGKPEELFEIRVGYDPDQPGKFLATLISGKPDDGQNMDTPEPAEPELQDA